MYNICIHHLGSKKVSENTIGAPKMRYQLFDFQYCDSNVRNFSINIRILALAFYIGLSLLFSIAPSFVIALPTIAIEQEKQYKENKKRSKELIKAMTNRIILLSLFCCCCSNLFKNEIMYIIIKSFYSQRRGESNKLAPTKNALN